MNEFELIKRYFSRASGRADVVVGVGDDAAVLDVPPGLQLVAAVDTIIEGIHFPAGTSAVDIGYRALAVNLSDIAAMGAEPRWITLSLTTPRADASWLEGFAAGLYELAARHDVALVGGDTCKGPLVISVQVLGTIEYGRALLRAGARPGDAIYVSGVPGEAAAGLALLQSNAERDSASEHLVRRFLRPEPRLNLGRSLRGVASAAMDISDGLVTDLTKLCAASHCGARLDLERLPLSTPMHARFTEAQVRHFTLAGGDDYELLFTVPREHEPQLSAFDVPCTRVGEIVAGDGVGGFLHGEKIALPSAGFDHFREEDT
jgi:thiamine-monophosphate kinase